MKILDNYGCFLSDIVTGNSEMLLETDNYLQVCKLFFKLFSVAKSDAQNWICVSATEDHYFGQIVVPATIA